MTETAAAAAPRQYSYLGPAGTFTEAALKQVKEAAGQPWKPVLNVAQAFADVVSGESHAAMIAIENSIDGGVTATQDALAVTPGLQVIGEYIVPVNFVLVTRPGVSLEDVRVVAAHPVAYAQCLPWLGEHLPDHTHLQSTSNVQAVLDLFEEDLRVDAALAPPGIEEHHDVVVQAEHLASNPDAVTRFVLVAKQQPIGLPSGHDKTSVIAELAEERAGALLELLEQFATRGVNLVLITSRPIGDRLGRYRFVIDAEGHVTEKRVAEALKGLKRVSPNVKFLGSYPRADRESPVLRQGTEDRAYMEADAWFTALLHGQPVDER